LNAALAIFLRLGAHKDIARVEHALTVLAAEPQRSATPMPVR
jgi:hypothetical protein